VKPKRHKKAKAPQAEELRTPRPLPRDDLIGSEDELLPLTDLHKEAEQDLGNARAEISRLREIVAERESQLAMRTQSVRVHAQKIEQLQLDLDSKSAALESKSTAMEVRVAEAEAQKQEASQLRIALDAAKEAAAFHEKQIDLLLTWLERLSFAFRSLLRTGRWKLGDFAVSLKSRLMGRPSGVPFVKEAQKTLDNYDVWVRDRAQDSSRGSPVGATCVNPPLLDASPTYDILMFANINWEERYQRPQQIAAQFARNGHRVFYIVASEVLCSAPPSTYQATEVMEGVLQVKLAGPRQIDRYAEVIDSNCCDAFVLSLNSLQRDYDIQDAALQVQLPSWMPLVRLVAGRRDWAVIYDCMDEWAGFPGIGQPLLDAENELIDFSDVLTVTASVLEKKWKSRKEDCLLVRNGVDHEFFVRHCTPNDILLDVSHPIIGYYGALADWVDFELLSSLARRRPDWQFVLLGDVFVDDLAGLDELPNVHLLGRRPYEEMPLYLHHFDVCLIPFELSGVTHAVDPVKFYEFMSAGKPVVAAPLEELKIYSEYLRFAETPGEFEREIESLLKSDDTDSVQRRVDLGARNDWKHRYEVMHQAVVTKAPKVSIIIVSFENVELTQLCLESVFANTTHPNYEVIVVDNASSDSTPEYLRDLEVNEPRVKVILNTENLGFAAANNQGLAIAEGEFLLLLNNDTVVPRGWLSPLIRQASLEDVGLVGPVTNFVGNEAKVDVPYADDLDGMGDFAADHMREHKGQSFDIKVLAMFCVLMRRDVYEEVGPLDEAFGIGMFEDDDYSYRMREAGYRTVCAEDAFIHHFGQAAFKKLIESGAYGELWEKNQAVFESKWGAWEAHVHRSAEE